MESINYDRQIEKMKPEGKVILPEFMENFSNLVVDFITEEVRVRS